MTGQTPSLQGMRIGFVVANEGVEEVELTKPWEAVEAAGGVPELVAPKAGPVQAMHHLDKSRTFPAERTTEHARADDYDAIVLPGGVANPDQLRTDPAAVRLLQAIAAAGKPIAAICHGPWTLIEAGLVNNRTLTSWPSLQTDIRNAGGTWVDSQVEVDAQGPSLLVTSRKPDDLPAFCDTFVRVLADAHANRGLTRTGS